MILHGDCLEKLKTLADASVDSVVTDPPYGLSFMGKKWDYDVPSVDVWREVLRVLKPGGHALIACGTRTQHRMVVNIEDAGFEIRDVVTWLYGQGFPKASALNRQNRDAFCQCASNTRNTGSTSLGQDEGGRTGKGRASDDGDLQSEGAQRSTSKPSDSQGGCRPSCDSSGELAHACTMGGQASSPRPGCAQERTRSGEPCGGAACESSRSPSGAQCSVRPSSRGSSRPENGSSDRPVSKRGSSIPAGISGSSLSRSDSSQGLSSRGFLSQCKGCGKPIVDGWYTPALKPACEFWTLARKPLDGTVAANVLKHGTGGLNIDGCRIESGGDHKRPFQPTNNERNTLGKQAAFMPTNAEGRFPANLILDEEAAAALDEQSGVRPASRRENPSVAKNSDGYGSIQTHRGARGFVDSGGASRFFYVAKVSPSERNAGLEGMPDRKYAALQDNGKDFKTGSGNAREAAAKNHHPTVKPVKLMRYLCRLITPPGGLVLDPFAGSGSTGVAAVMEGFQFVGIEREAEYVAIAERRLESKAK